MVPPSLLKTQRVSFPLCPRYPALRCPGKVPSPHTHSPFLQLHRSLANLERTLNQQACTVGRPGHAGSPTEHPPSQPSVTAMEPLDIR